MTDLIVIIVPQEYKNANHKYLWHSISKNSETKVLILDVPADYLITKFKGKQYRIQENRKGLINLGSNIDKYRPIYYVRPEILPNFFNFLISRTLFRQLSKLINFAEYNLSFIVYHPKWVKVVKDFRIKNKVYYYLLDEIHLNADDDRKVKKNIANDKDACEKCDHLFVMTHEIKEKRHEHIDKITVIGNGSRLNNETHTEEKLEMSVGFVGNFRNWIDESLLSSLVKNRKDLTFCFVGPIEKNMNKYMTSLLNNNRNTVYFGAASKEEVSYYYRRLNVVIVPYKQNKFMLATRPIKIVESIFAGTPVVSIPMSGYEENSFIKYATNYQEFSDNIDFLIKNPINRESIEYKDFLNDNSWEKKSQVILSLIKNMKNKDLTTSK
jgi:glycosyltransferase involved in cell wall biosynthesis